MMTITDPQPLTTQHRRKRRTKGGLRRRGGIWHIDVSIRGRRIRESCATENYDEAIAFVRQRVAEIDRRGSLALRAPRVTFDDLTVDYLADYEVNGKRSLGKAKKSVERLKAFFGGRRAVQITTADIRAYVERRKRHSFANGSINRELAALKRMFRLAVKAKLISYDHVPDIPMLQEAPPRSGFFEPHQFQAVLMHLAPEVCPLAVFAYETGWRLREVMGLEWRQVDIEAGRVRLAPGSTKNGDGRVVRLSPQLHALLRKLHAATKDLERRRDVIVRTVFHRRGRPIRAFYRNWRTACIKAGVPSLVFHDLRRTAVRNMVRAGIPERVAMTISGHKTRSVFERYNIVNEADLEAAAQRMGQVYDIQSASTTISPA